MASRTSRAASPSERFHKRHRALDIFFSTSVALSPLALGGTHPLASFGLCAWFVVLTLTSFWLQKAHDRAWRIYVPAIASLALILIVLLRATPGSGGASSEIVTEAYTLWPSLSPTHALAPGRAPLWAARTLTFCAVMLYAAMRFSRSDRYRTALWGVFGAGAVLAAVALIQELSGATKILGIYEPLDWARMVPRAGTFVNPNQAGALAGIAAIAAFCLASLQGPAPLRALQVLLGAALAAYVFALEANGAAVALIAALFTLPVALYAQRTSRERASWVLTGWLVSLWSLAAILLWSVVPKLELLRSATLLQKTQIWARALEVPLSAPWLGYGAGGFAEAYAALGLNVNHVWVGDPESGPLQALSEHGFPITIAIAALIVYCLRRGFYLRASGTPAVAIAPPLFFAYIGVETISGLGLHASSYIIAVGVVVGALVGRSARTAESPKPTRLMLAQPLALALCASVVLCASAGGIRASLNDSLPPLPAEFRATHPDPEAWRERLLQRARQVPSSPPLLAQAAWLEIALDNPERALILAQGLRRHAPNYPRYRADATIVALRAGETATGCAWLQEDAERFRALQPPAIEQLVASGVDVLDCFASGDHQRIAWRAVNGIRKYDLAHPIAFQLANAPNASAASLVIGIDAALQQKIPELASLWVDELLRQPLQQREHFESLIAWMIAAKPDAQTRGIILERALTAFPSEPIYHILLAEHLTQDARAAGRREGPWYTQAQVAIEAALKNAQADPQITLRARQAHADAAWVADDLEGAKLAYGRLERYIDPAAGERTRLSRTQEIELHLRLGKIAIRDADYFHAQRRLRRVLELDPNHAEARDELAKIGG